MAGRTIVTGEGGSRSDQAVLLGLSLSSAKAIGRLLVGIPGRIFRFAARGCINYFVQVRQRIPTTLILSRACRGFQKNVVAT